MNKAKSICEDGIKQTINVLASKSNLLISHNN